MISLMNLTVDMIIEGLSYIEAMMIWNYNVECGGICVRIIYCALSISVWSNYRLMGRMWPATAFSVARGRIQEKSSNLKFVEKRERLHLSHWIACTA